DLALGTVVNYDPVKGFGFLQAEGIHGDIFFSRGELPEKLRESEKREQVVGQKMEFELYRNTEGKLRGKRFLILPPAGSKSATPPLGPRARGKILKYDKSKGFGFISCKYANDVFFMRSQLPKEYIECSMEELKELDVSFEMYMKQPGKPRANAIEVLGKDGSPEQGEFPGEEVFPEESKKAKSGEVLSGVIINFEPVKGYGFLKSDNVEERIDGAKRNPRTLAQPAIGWPQPVPAYAAEQFAAVELRVQQAREQADSTIAAVRRVQMDAERQVAGFAAARTRAEELSTQAMRRAARAEVSLEAARAAAAAAIRAASEAARAETAAAVRAANEAARADTAAAIRAAREAAQAEAAAAIRLAEEENERIRRNAKSIIQRLKGTPQATEPSFQAMNSAARAFVSATGLMKLPAEQAHAKAQKLRDTLFERIRKGEKLPQMILLQDAQQIISFCDREYGTGDKVKERQPAAPPALAAAGARRDEEDMPPHRRGVQQLRCAIRKGPRGVIMNFQRRIQYGPYGPQISQVKVATYKTSRDTLWFSRPGAYVCCDACLKAVPQSRGSLQGAPQRSRFAHDEFLCTDCMMNGVGPGSGLTIAGPGSGMTVAGSGSGVADLADRRPPNTATDAEVLGTKERRARPEGPCCDQASPSNGCSRPSCEGWVEVGQQEAGAESFGSFVSRARSRSNQSGRKEGKDASHNRSGKKVENTHHSPNRGEGEMEDRDRSKESQSERGAMNQERNEKRRRVWQQDEEDTEGQQQDKEDTEGQQQDEEDIQDQQSDGGSTSVTCCCDRCITLPVRSRVRCVCRLCHKGLAPTFSRAVAAAAAVCQVHCARATAVHTEMRVSSQTTMVIVILMTALILAAMWWTMAGRVRASRVAIVNASPSDERDRKCLNCEALGEEVVALVSVIDRLDDRIEVLENSATRAVEPTQGGGVTAAAKPTQGGGGAAVRKSGRQLIVPPSVRRRPPARNSVGGEQQTCGGMMPTETEKLAREIVEGVAAMAAKRPPGDPRRWQKAVEEDSASAVESDYGHIQPGDAAVPVFVAKTRRGSDSGWPPLAGAAHAMTLRRAATATDSPGGTPHSAACRLRRGKWRQEKTSIQDFGEHVVVPKNRWTRLGKDADRERGALERLREVPSSVVAGDGPVSAGAKEFARQAMWNCQRSDNRQAKSWRSGFIGALPSADGRKAHEVTHLPYQQWRPVCVSCKAADSPHHRLPEEGADGTPVVEFDYGFVSPTGQADECEAPVVLVARAETSAQCVTGVDTKCVTRVDTTFSAEVPGEGCKC
ncbi:unnamed protein product, partial [Polarella glacialis]